jgi:hypothetical protein
MAGVAAMDQATRSINVIGADVEGGIATVAEAGDDVAGAPQAPVGAGEFPPDPVAPGPAS